MVATLTSKGQITIPKPVRDRLKLQPGDLLDFAIAQDGSIQLIALTDSVRKLQGMAPKPKKIISLEEMRIAIEECRTK